jgi:hypothetical protein
LIAGVLLSHAFSGELKAVSVVNEAIQDGVAEGWVAVDEKVKDVTVPFATPSLAMVSGAGACVGPMMKLDLGFLDPKP